MKTYEEGWNDALDFIASAMRVTADQVEMPSRKDVETDRGKFNVIAKSGSPQFARRLRELADTLERSKL